MFDVLVREAGARFGLGDKALPLVQMLLAYMTDKNTGGLAGFLEKFKASGLGPIIQSWLGGGPAAQPISNSQLETALGGSGGLLSLLTSKLDAGRDNVASALGYLLPALVGKMTPGGSIPSSLPPEILSMANTGHSLLSATPVAAAAAPAGGGGGGFAKWLPWIIVALAAVFGVSYLMKDKAVEAPPAVESTPATPSRGDWGPGPASTASPAAAAATASEPASAAPPAAATVASEAAPAAPAASEATPASAAPAAATASAAATSSAAAGADEPVGSAVVDLMSNGMPALNVYFDSGKTEVHADFAGKATDLVAFMKANADVKAAISGFNDPTGDAAVNAELSKNRAKAVQAALVAQGIAEDRLLLEKPVEATGTAASNAASRRVEVVLRK